MKLVCISDTHTYHNEIKVPDGDVLIHAGDITDRGELSTLFNFMQWIRSLPHKHKIIISGNHDFCFQNNHDVAKSIISDGAIYLQDESVVIDGIKFYGTPWQPWFYDWAFNADEKQLQNKWELIDTDTNVLIVHGPPNRVLDRTKSGHHTGCIHLLNKIAQIKPKYVVCGHIHESYGIKQISDYTTVVNASICNLSYDPINSPIEIEI